MKVVHRLAFVLTVAGLVAAPGFGQTAEDRTTVVGLNLLGPVVGLYSGSFEQAIDDELSIFVIPSYFNAKAGIFDALASVGGIEREDYDIWFLAVAAGVNYFLDGTAPAGVFAGGWLQPGYGHARFEGSALGVGEHERLEGGTVTLTAGAHVGYRLIWGPVAVTPRVGISYQFALDPVSGFDPQIRTLADNVGTGLQFPWGVDIGIAF